MRKSNKPPVPLEEKAIQWTAVVYIAVSLVAAVAVMGFGYGMDEFVNSPANTGVAYYER